MKQPIPDEVLDDRLFFGGTSGSGKSYNAMGRVERLLKRRARAVIVDPLGVWWGLRLLADGVTPSGLDVVIFGGKHGDLPLTEHAGALLAETVVGMKESCILDLSQLGTKAAERRFMLEFLTVLYRHLDGTPLHVVFDEADIFAPQSLVGDKDGPAPRLLGMMETVVRRGRVKGFIPWLISQRPAVLNKNVLSQADGIVAFKLTASQDRDAIAAWVEGQADKATWRAMYGELATAAVGEGLVWIPARGILERVQFPAKTTFDSTRTPKRGEKAVHRDLQPLDVGALRERLAKVEVEAKANDPKELRAEIARLKGELAKKVPAVAPLLPDQKVLVAEYERGYGAGIDWAFDAYGARLKDAGHRLRHLAGELGALDSALAIEPIRPKKFPRVDIPHIPRAVSPTVAAPSTNRPAPPPQRRAAEGNGALPPALQKVINAIGWWRQIGFDPVRKERACVVAGYSPRASTFGVYLADLAKRGLIVSGQGTVGLTSEGVALAVVPTGDTREELRTVARGLLSPQEQRVFDVVYDAYPNEIRRDEVAEKVGLSPTASTAGVYISGVAAYGIIEAASRGHVKAADWLFP